MKHTKQAVIDEILRFNRILTQCKYGSEDDKVIKKLIAENLAKLSEIESAASARKIKRQKAKFLAELASCM